MGSGADSQIYTFLEGLRVVNGREDRGLVIGLSIAKSLLTYDLTSRRRELQKDEVRVVHQGLEEAVTRCSSYDSQSVQSHFSYLCDLKAVVEPLLAQLGTSSSTPDAERSTLKKTLEQQLQRARNPSDRLRRDGLILIDLSLRRGPSYGSRNILIADYELLKEVLRQ